MRSRTPPKYRGMAERAMCRRIASCRDGPYPELCKQPLIMLSWYLFVNYGIKQGLQKRRKVKLMVHQPMKVPRVEMPMNQLRDRIS